MNDTDAQNIIELMTIMRIRVDGNDCVFEVECLDRQQQFKLFHQARTPQKHYIFKISTPLH